MKLFILHITTIDHALDLIQGFGYARLAMGQLILPILTVYLQGIRLKKLTSIAEVQMNS